MRRPLGYGMLLAVMADTDATPKIEIRQMSGSHRWSAIARSPDGQWQIITGLREQADAQRWNEHVKSRKEKPRRSAAMF